MSKPNILIIFGDDLGVDTLRIDAAAKSVTVQVNNKDVVAAGPVKLPTFSRLVASGIHFSNAWSHPVCTPTRASLWSGMQPWKTKGLGYPPNDEEDLSSPAITGDEIKSFAQSLAGYKCAMFGKWDLGTKKTPVDWGWDTYAGILRGGLRGDGILYYGFPGKLSRINMDNLSNAKNAAGDAAQPEKCAAAAKVIAANYDASFLKNNPDLRNYFWVKDAIGADGKPFEIRPEERKHIYITEDQVADAKAWIIANKDQGPWCVALTLVAPHDPFHVPPPGTYQESTIKDPTKPTVQEMLAAMVQSVDYYINDLLTAIEGELANTVIITAFDNGTQDTDPDDRTVSVDGITGDDKGTSGIGGVLVPMIVTDGGLLTGGAPCYVTTPPCSIPAPVHTMDIYHTALDIAGVAPISNIDSISFAPLLNQSVQKPTRTHNFSQMYDVPSTSSLPSKGIDASVADYESKYKLTCLLLTDANGFPLDRAGNPTTSLVWDYSFTKLVADPLIPGSLVEEKINALVVNPNGSFTVNDLAYEGKVMELYTVMARERRYDNDSSRFPVILPASASLSSTSWSENRLDIFYRGTDQALWQKFWNGQAWSDWQSLVGSIRGKPASVAWGPNRLDIFVRGSDNALWHRRWDGQTWSDWESLDGHIISDPTAVSWSSNRLDVFAQGSDLSLWHKCWDGSSWRDWKSLGGVIVGAPTAVSWGENRLDVFARGTDGALLTWCWDGQTWCGCVSLGGFITSIPVAVAWEPNRLDVFARGTDGTLWHKYWDGQSWQAWESLGGAIIGPPSAVCRGPNRIDLFARGTDSGLLHKCWDGSAWSEWESLGGVIYGAPECVSLQANSLNVFARDTDGAVWTWSRLDGQPGAWEALGGAIG